MKRAVLVLRAAVGLGIVAAAAVRFAARLAAALVRFLGAMAVGDVLRAVGRPDLAGAVYEAERARAERRLRAVRGRGR